MFFSFDLFFSVVEIQFKAVCIFCKGLPFLVLLKKKKEREGGNGRGEKEGKEREGRRREGGKGKEGKL